MNISGKVSWFGGPHDREDSGHTASGGTTAEPGIAVYNHGTLGGYWRVRAPNGRTVILRQTDIGPAPWTGRKVDVTYSALGKFGYNEGNFPTDATVNAEYLGRKPPKGGAAETMAMPQPKAPALPGPSAQSKQVPGQAFDQAGFDKAQKAAVLGKLLSSSGESKENPLFATGLVTTKLPQRSEFEVTQPEVAQKPQVAKTPSGPVFVPAGARNEEIGGTRAVEFGIHHIGKYAETSGSNLGPELNQLERQFGMTGEPWCAIFATTAVNQGGASRATRTASVAQINEWAQQGSHGYQRGLKPTSQAQAGDLITFGSQHVGLVKARHGNVIVTIEGNANGSGGVRERTRNINEGQIARPLYRKT